MATWNFKAGGATVGAAPNITFPTKTSGSSGGSSGGSSSGSYTSSNPNPFQTWQNMPSYARPLPTSGGTTGGSTGGNTGGYTGGSSGGRSGGGSGSSGGGLTASDLYGQLMTSYLDQANARAQAQYEAQRAAAQAAYERGMAYLNDAYNSQQGSLRDNYNSTIGQLMSSYNNSKGKVNADASRSLQEAYINRMLSERNLGQQMAAQGLSGGASESTMASLYNNYGNARNGIEKTRATNLSDLENTLNQNKASALQTLNNALANLESERMQYAMQLENALANNQISASQNFASALDNVNGNYLDMLQGYLKNMGDYNYTPTEALNTVKAVAMTQAANENNTNYRNYMNLLGNLATGSQAQNNIIGANTNANAALLQQLLSQLA